MCRQLVSTIILATAVVAGGNTTARAGFITVDWTVNSSTSATGLFGDDSISVVTSPSAPFRGILTDTFTPPRWSAPLPLPLGTEGLWTQPVNPGAFQSFNFSGPQSTIRLYVDDFDSASDAILSAPGATSITLLGSSPSMSYTPLSGSSGRLLTSNGGFNGEGDAVLEITGSFTLVQLDYTGGIQNNAVFYTFAKESSVVSPVPEPTSVVLFGLGGLVLGAFRWRRSSGRESA